MREALILRVVQVIYRLYLREVLLEVVQATPNKLDDRLIPAMDVLLGIKED